MHHHAVTDLYDEKRRDFYVRFPFWIMTPFLILGITAFAVVGLFGYPDDLIDTHGVLQTPWPIFAWLCLAHLVIQGAILRHPKFRVLQIVQFTIAMMCIGAVVGLWQSDFGASVSQLPIQYLGVLAVAGVVLIGLNLWLFALLQPRIHGLFGILPCLLITLVSITLYGISAFLTQAYLHGSNQLITSDPRLAFAYGLLIAIGAVVSTIGGLVGLCLGPAVLVGFVRVASNALAYISYAISLLVLTIPALILINAVTWFAALSSREPFFQPNLTTLGALALFVFTGRDTVLASIRLFTDRATEADRATIVNRFRSLVRAK